MANRTRPGHGAVGAYNHPPAPAHGRCPPRPAPAHGPGHGAVRAYHYPPAPAHGRCPPPPAPLYGGGYPHARAYGGNRGNAPARYDGIVADGIEGLAMGAAGAAAIMSGGNPPPLAYGQYQNNPIIPFVAVGVEALAAAFTDNY